MRLRSAAATCLVALALSATGSLTAGESAVPAEAAALCDAWFAATDDDARLAVEAKAAALAPLPAEAVAPIAEKLFALAAKTGPRLKKSGSSYFYDEKAKKGLYMVSPAAKKHGGLLISMHGGGENQGDAGSAHGIWGGATAQGLTVVSPEVMTKVGSAWNEAPEERMVLEIIEAAKRTFDIDANRIYLAGHSMGGDGSWMIGGRNADLFAGCAPLAGSVMPYMKEGTRNKRATPRSAYEGLMEGVIPNLLHAHYFICHSADDENEAVHPDDIAVAHLKTLAERRPGKYEHRYDRIDGNGHALPPTGVKPILEWLTKRTRTTYPDEVVWETWWPWKRQMYWLYHPSPLEAWRFHARVVAPNHVDVTATTKPLQGRTAPKSLDLTLLLSPKMFDLASPLKVTCGGTVLFEGPVARSLWAMLVSVARRNDPEQWFEGHVTVAVPRAAWTDFWDAPVTPSGDGRK